MNPFHLPQTAIIDRRIQESAQIFSLRLRFRENRQHENFSFIPGQFNMLTLPGIGEIPVSIVSDPEDAQFFDHTIRVVGRVTEGLSKLQTGEQIGIRGPFGRGWPLDEVRHKDIVLVTGGLGCAPLVSVIHYLLRRRTDYGRIFILQGVKHADDLIWRKQYEKWSREERVHVDLAADIRSSDWPWQQGRVTELIDPLTFEANQTVAMLCGPEIMMLAAVQALQAKQIPAHNIWLSLERNMQCAIGQCGHCQLGPRFVCRDGPVFCYPDVAELLTVKGM